MYRRDKMCKLTKNLPIQGGGLLDFQDLGEDFTKGRGIQGGGVETSVGAMVHFSDFLKLWRQKPRRLKV